MLKGCLPFFFLTNSSDFPENFFVIFSQEYEEWKKKYKPKIKYDF